MAEYISREFMLKNLEADKTNNAEHCDTVTVQIMERFIRYVKEFPAADVQPVKRGRWIKDEKGTFHHCSECGSESFRDVDSWGLEYQEYCTDYCPHCGARMIKDGEQNDTL